MQFGLGQQLQGGKFDWSHIHRHMTGRWPPLSLGQTCRYAELVMAQLSEPANDKPYFADGIAKKEILQAYEFNKVNLTDRELKLTQDPEAQCACARKGHSPCYAFLASATAGMMSSFDMHASFKLCSMIAARRFSQPSTGDIEHTGFRVSRCGLNFARLQVVCINNMSNMLCRSWIAWEHCIWCAIPC